jgi:hypothetical protein
MDDYAQTYDKGMQDVVGPHDLAFYQTSSDYVVYVNGAVYIESVSISLAKDTAEFIMQHKPDLRVQVMRRIKTTEETEIALT